MGVKSKHDMCELDQAKISRGKFFGLGLSAALLSSGIAPYVAKAQTVNFGASTSGKLSDYCRGDGSDETDQIRKCLREHLFVEIDEPPAGVGYGFHIDGSDGGLLLRSGQEINSQGANSKLLRVGKWARNRIGLRNYDRINGNSSIKLNNVYIEGFRNRSDIPYVDSDSDSTGISIRAIAADKRCRYIELTGVEVHNWPGVSFRNRNVAHVKYTDVKSVNPARGGITFNTSNDIKLLRARSINSGDDAIAFYAAGYRHNNPTPNRPTHGITVDQCESYTRENPQFGAAIKFRGAREALVTNSTFRHSKGSSVFLKTEYPGALHPVDIRIRDCRMRGSMRNSFHIVADGARLISVRRNYMYKPAQNCVYICSLDGMRHTFDVNITDNTMVDPGSGRYAYVEEGISGVSITGNRQLSSDARPRISNVSPAPGSTTRDATPTIRATVRDSVTNLSKYNTKLYFGGKAISRTSFNYDRIKNLLTYTTPKLSRGKKTVKIVATDAAGNTSRKTWSFTVS